MTPFAIVSSTVVAFGFVALAIIIGSWTAPALIRLIDRIDVVRGLFFTSVVLPYPWHTSPSAPDPPSSSAHLPRGLCWRERKRGGRSRAKCMTWRTSSCRSFSWLSDRPLMCAL